MQCANCRASIIGSVPSSLRNARRCPKCYPSYVVEQALKTEIDKKKQEEIDFKKQKEMERLANEEKIDDRFDILDL